MSDTQAREAFEAGLARSVSGHSLIRLPSGAYDDAGVELRWQYFLRGYEAGRKAGLEEAKAIASERARKFRSASFGSGKERASGAESVAYHIDKTIKALITKPGEKD